MCVDFCLVGFEPYPELVRLISVVVPLLFAFVCKFGLLAFYSFDLLQPFRLTQLVVI